MIIINDKSTAELSRRAKAVIFDLDGTLIDSMPIWRRLILDYLTQNGVGKPESAAFQERILGGYNIFEICDLLSGGYMKGKTPSEILSEIHDVLMYKYATECKLKPRTRAILDTFKHAGLPMSVATATHRVPAEFVLRHHNLYEYFSGIYTVPEVGKSKTHPDIYHIACDDMGASVCDTGCLKIIIPVLSQ